MNLPHQVMKDSNVRICKLDSVANMTMQFHKWLQTEGVPNIVFLGRDTKNQAAPCVHKFGACGEDRDVNLRVQAMVSFIYKHIPADRKSDLAPPKGQRNEWSNGM